MFKLSYTSWDPDPDWIPPLFLNNAIHASVNSMDVFRLLWPYNWGRGGCAHGQDVQ